jgi:cytoskeleton protein RodZ
MKEVLRPGYGQLLAEARAEKGMSLADVAAKLKLTVRQVEAMELEAADQLPGDVFLRGFARNYGRLLELNPDDLIVPMDAGSAVAQTITAPSEGVILKTGGLKRWVIVPLVILGIFIVFVAALYQWLRQGEDALVSEASEEPAAVVVTQPAPPIADSAEPASVAVVSAPEFAAPVTPNTVAPTGAGGADTGNAPIKQTPPPVATERAATNASPPPENPRAAANGNHVLRFAASQDAWIQVVDGQGRRFSKLVRAGGSDSISGVAPFRLVVGEAALVRLTYDGHPIDLTPFIGQKVARLTLE